MGEGSEGVRLSLGAPSGFSLLDSCISIALGVSKTLPIFLPARDLYISMATATIPGPVRRCPRGTPAAALGNLTVGSFTSPPRHVQHGSFFFFFFPTREIEQGPWQ